MKISMTSILIMQGICITLQIINSDLRSVLPDTKAAAFIVLCVAAVTGGTQFIVQHLGNQMNPNGKNGNGKPPDPPITK
jgi:hypothetical protein